MTQQREPENEFDDLEAELDDEIPGEDPAGENPAAIDYDSMDSKTFEAAVTKIKDDPPAPPQDEFAILKPWTDDLREHLAQSRAKREAGANDQVDDAEAGFDLSLLEPAEFEMVARFAAGGDGDPSDLERLARKYQGLENLFPEGTI